MASTRRLSGRSFTSSLITLSDSPVLIHYWERALLTKLRKRCSVLVRLSLMKLVEKVGKSWKKLEISSFWQPINRKEERRYEWTFDRATDAWSKFKSSESKLKPVAIGKPGEQDEPGEHADLKGQTKDIERSWAFIGESKKVMFYRCRVPCKTSDGSVELVSERQC